MKDEVFDSKVGLHCKHGESTYDEAVCLRVECYWRSMEDKLIIRSWLKLFHTSVKISNFSTKIFVLKKLELQKLVL